MTQNRLCISIPKELQQFTKVSSFSLDEFENNFAPGDFGVKLIKDDLGNLCYAAYYSDRGDLLKKIYYTGAAISKIEHYRNNSLYTLENYKDGNLVNKSKFGPNGDIVCRVKYRYNMRNNIILIQKLINERSYDVEYGYDELYRVNSRIIKIDKKIVEEQYYKYDILDRIVEYKDRNQSIIVHKINPNNELISYVIKDRLGNCISIKNKFLCSEYIGTEIDLNDHQTTVNDKSYIDNIMLKKPFTSEDDLDFIISNLFKPPKLCKNQLCMTKRNNTNDILNHVIDDKISTNNKPLPISMRKQLLLQQAS